MAVNTVDKLQFLSFIYITINNSYCVNEIFLKMLKQTCFYLFLCGMSHYYSLVNAKPA